MKEKLGSGLVIDWRYFSLEQVNNEHGPEWKLWKQPVDYASRGRNAFRAAEAARQQGQEAFEAFHMAVLKARHEDHREIADAAVLVEVALSAGLDVEQFRGNLANPGMLDRLAEDHTFAAEHLRVFGTPTLVFAEEQALFLKMAPPPSDEEAVAVFTEVRQIAEGRAEIREMKRP